MSKADLARRTADLGADHDVTRPCPLCGDDGRLVGVSVTGNGVYFCEGDRSPYRTGGPTGCDHVFTHAKCPTPSPTESKPTAGPSAGARRARKVPPPPPNQVALF